MPFIIGFILSATLFVTAISCLLIDIRGNGTVYDAPSFIVLSDVPRNLRNNHYLQVKEKGCCKSLTGEIAVTVVMVSDSVGVWDAESAAYLKTSLEEYGQDIIAEAETYHTELSFSFHYYDAQLTGDICSGEYEKDWQDPALKEAGLPNLIYAHKYLEKLYSAKEAPVVFAFNKPGRAYAELKGNEFLVLYARNDFHSFKHELFHIFGAEDYYYPEEVDAAAVNYLPDSIMNGGETVDPLTAYSIGWTDELSDSALQFLQETNALSADYIKQARSDDSFTGIGTKKFDNGTYTGDLVRGERHGTGTMHYNNGGWYTGQWKSGSQSGIGNGKIIYKDGAVYEGELLDGKYHGTGTIQYANGSWYTGTWEAGKRIGKGNGKTVFKSGAVYEGEYQDGNQHGQGTYIWTNGEIYVGEWTEGKITGYGTVTKPDDSVFTGYWLDGVFQG